MLSIVVVLIALFGILAVAIFGTLTRQARLLHAYALQTCSTWLPALALALYVSLALSSLFKNAFVGLGMQCLTLDLSPLEGSILLFAALLFATKFINLTAIGTTCLYLIFIFHNGHALLKIPELIFLTAQLVLVFMGDKAVWQQPFAGSFGVVTRRIGVTSVLIAAILTVIFSFFYLEDVRHLLDARLALRISRSLVATILTALLIGWLGVGIRSLRPFLMPFLALPTVILMQALGLLGNFGGTVTFLVILSISWATSERRQRLGTGVDGNFSHKISFR